MTRLRSLADVARAARAQGLRVVPTLMREVLFECPVCKAAGLRSMACVEIALGYPTMCCAGCERWGGEPFDILRILGHDANESDDPLEDAIIYLFCAWVALERERRAGVPEIASAA